MINTATFSLSIHVIYSKIEWIFNDWRKLFVLLFVVFISSIAYSQLPECDKFYLHSNDKIYIYDALTNTTTLNTITIPTGCNGLAVNDNFFSSTPSPTFYTIKGGVIYYFNGSSWISTGHSSGSSSAVNPGGSGPYIYILDGLGNKIYRYDGTGNSTLFLSTTLNGPFDCMGDAEGNLYIINGTQLRMYNTNAQLVCTYDLLGYNNTGIGGGYSIVNGVVYAHNGTNSFKGIISGSTITFTPITFNVSGVISDFANCPFPPLNVTIDPPSIISCGTNSVQLTAHTTITNPVFSWSGPGIVSGGNTATPTVNQPGTYTVVVTGSGAAGGCGATGTQQVIVLSNTAATTPSFTNPGPICAGSNFTLPTISENNISGTWSPAINITTTTTYTFTPATTECATSITMEVTVDPAPNATISYATPFCASESSPQFVTLTGTTGGTFSASPSGLSINATTGAITPSTSIENSYTVTYTIPANGSCSAYSTTFDIVISSNSTIHINPVSDVCSNANVISLVASPAGGTFSGNGVSGNTFNPTNANIGDNVITYSLSSVGSCPAVSDTIHVTVKQAPNATIAYSNLYCISESSSQEVNIIGTTGGSFSASPPGLDINPVTGDIIPASSTEGVYTVTYSIPSDGVYAAFSTTKDVTIQSLPTINIAGITEVCSGKSTSLTATGGIAYTWSTGDTTASVFIAPTLPTTYTVIGKDINGCIGTASISVNVLSGPIADFTADPDLGYAPLTVEFTNNSTNTIDYSWDFGNGDISHSEDTSTTYTEVGDYEVTLVVSNNLCKDTASLIIKVINSLGVIIEAPNVFTPNGDGTNDYFSIYTENAKTFYVEIFNRWGELMITLEKTSDKWDGGKAVDGVYFYKYRITDHTDTVYEGHGFLHLQR